MKEKSENSSRLFIAMLQEEYGSLLVFELYPLLGMPISLLFSVKLERRDTVVQSKG